MPDQSLLDKLAESAPHVDLDVTCECGHRFNSKAVFAGHGSSHGMDQDLDETYAWESEPVCEKCGMRLNAELTLSATQDEPIYLSDLHTRGCKVKIVNKEVFYKKIGYKPAVPDSL